MVVVVMVGVLATLATIGVRKYIFASKTSEAINMIGSIKAAQEAYKDETFSYLNVSSSLTSYYPADPDNEKRQWGGSGANADKWRALGINADTAVQFGYACVAGGASDSVPQPGTAHTFTYPTPGGPWYVVKAVSDFDENGIQGIFVSSSFTTEIYSENDGE